MSSCLWCVVVCGWGWLGTAAFTNQKGRDTVVLAAPSVWDTTYAPKFLDLIQFQMKMVQMVEGHDNVVLLADQHTLPYLNGRTLNVRDSLPPDVLLEADVYDINLRDFAPLGIKEMTKFDFRSRTMDPIVAKQIDFSMKKFLAAQDLFVDRNETQLQLSAADIVDNGVDKAIISDRILDDNKGRLPDWAASIKLLSIFKQVALVPLPNATSNSTLRLDDMFAWIDDDVLLVAAMSTEDRLAIEDIFRRKFFKNFVIVDLPAAHSSDDHLGSCGMYTALLATEHFLYLPVFGNDPELWKLGHSTMMDHKVVELVQVNTRKTVVPINMSRSICEMGLSLRSMSWVVKSSMADKLVEAARARARRRLYRYYQQ